MGLDDSVILSMRPGQRHAVTELAVAISADYDKTFFALSRLENFGFVESDPDNYWTLTRIGERLHEIFVKRNPPPS